jgi:hypothetical protein
MEERMDWGVVVWIALGVVGSGLVAGGGVAYRRSTKTGIRALSAALIAMGLAMWAVIGFTVPASTSSNGGESPAPVVATDVISSGTYEPFTQERVAALLNTDDINMIAGGGHTLAVEFRDGKEMAINVDASQVSELGIESWFTAGFQSSDPIRGITFSVMDFNSSQSAQKHFDNVIGETPGLIFMKPPIGDTSANVVFNGQGLGSIMMYRTGDLFVSLHTAQVFGIEPIMPVEGLGTLAQLVLTRMQQES